MTKHTNPKKPNKPLPDFETEWLVNKPGQHTTQRFERIVANQDTRQKSKLQSITMPKEIPKTNLTTIYAMKKGEWVKVGHKCADCGKPMNDPLVVEKHSLICKNDKEINRKEEQNILARVGKPAELPELPDDLLYEE
jgi:hypothetical protein